MARIRRVGNHKVFLCVFSFLHARYVGFHLLEYESQLSVPGEIKSRYSEYHIRVLKLFPNSTPTGTAVSRVSSVKTQTLRFYYLK